MEKELESLQLPIRDAMTTSPKRILQDNLAAKALQVMERHQITSLFVFEDVDASVPVGIIHLHDLLKAGVV
jgi:arabinose-5-phosphate isomerase